MLGSAALLAYWQASGLQQPAHATSSNELGYWVLLPGKLTAQAKRKLQRSKNFHVSEVKVKDNSFLKFLSSSTTDVAPPKGQALERPSPGVWQDALMPMLAQIKGSPAFEQVVIGKTGKMGLMRTLDPKVFLDWCHTPVGATLGIEPQSGEMVQQLVSERRIHSKVHVED